MAAENDPNSSPSRYRPSDDSGPTAAPTEPTRLPSAIGLLRVPRPTCSRGEYARP
jgi:hypothetical protein